VTLPRLDALMRAWEARPPTARLLAMIAAALGWKPKERQKKAQSREEALGVLAALGFRMPAEVRGG
jgi:hypothetical protein